MSVRALVLAALVLAALISCGAKPSSGVVSEKPVSGAGDSVQTWAIAAQTPSHDESRRQRIRQELIEQTRSKNRATRVAAFGALGYTGDEHVLTVLTQGIADADEQIRRASAISLGVLAKKKVTLGAPAVAGLIELLRGTADEKTAGAYAVSKIAEPLGSDALNKALASLSKTARGETLPMVVAALAGQRRIRGLARFLSAKDWRASVEAVRGLAGGASDAESHKVLSEWLVKEWSGEIARHGPRIHAATTALELLTKFAAESTVAHAARALYKGTGDGELRCRAAAILLRHGLTADEYLRCAGKDARWPEAERIALLADFLKATGGGAEQWQVWLSSPSPAVRAVAYSHAPLDEATILRGLKETAPVAVGAIAEALSKSESPLSSRVGEALLGRARTEKDVEVFQSLLGAIAATKVEGGAELCAEKMDHPIHAAARFSAQACLLKLTGQARGSTKAIAKSTPPVDRRPVLGKDVRWTLRTSRGTLVIKLDPRAAPWHVAAVVKLTRTGFYDGLGFHRVVPNFVIQGGDPTATGWGGPGFTLPAEPSNRPFVRGTVGIADTGPGTGGSQFFVMHSAAPRLDFRYTAIGEVQSGLEVVDSIRVGDKILSATIVVAR